MDTPTRLPALLAVLALALPVAGSADLDAIRQGLTSPGRADREAAEEEARARARLDPAGVAELWPDLDLRGRCALLRAIAGAGTRHAAAVALRFVAVPEPELAAALLAGLVDGGADALFAPLPDDAPAARREAVEQLRVRWRTEGELAARKSEHGPTGHYAGQYENVKAVGPAAIPVLLDILDDADRPIPGEAGAGRYRPIHPAMARFEPGELRQMVANAFAQVVDPGDEETKRRLQLLWATYWWTYEGDERHAFEHETLAPSLAFSLHDLGVPAPARRYLEDLERDLAQQRTRGRNAVRWDLGYAYIRLGRVEEGERMYQAILDDPWTESRHLVAYNLACSFSMRALQEPARAAEYRARAVAYLRLSVFQYQYAEWPWMEEDRDLDTIRGEAGYQEILAHLKTRYPDRRRREVSKDRRELLDPPPADERK